jgi:hypothetical protein
MYNIVALGALTMTPIVSSKQWRLRFWHGCLGTES